MRIGGDHALDAGSPSTALDPELAREWGDKGMAAIFVVGFGELAIVGDARHLK